MKKAATTLGLFLVLAGSVVTGCFAGNDDETDAAAGRGEKPPLSADTKVELYHLSEGSEFLPYAFLRALRVNDDGTMATTGGRPFLSPEHLARYNLIPSTGDALRRFPVGPSNVAKDMSGAGDQLPIGVTLARAPDTGLISLGVNCSACHVGQINVGGQSHVIDGAPNMFSIQAFFGDAISLLAASAKDEGFKKRAALEATGVILKFRDVKMDSGDTQDDKDSILDRASLIAALFDLAQAEDDAAAKKRIDELPAERFSKTRKALLLSRYFFVKGVKSRRTKGEGTPGGFGRTDAFGVARNALFGHLGEFKPTTAQVSFPPMFNMETNAWFHYNANADSVLGRNIGQSLGLGAVVDIYGDDGKGTNATFATSSNLANLALLEQAIYKIAPPAWPAKKDEALAAAGEKVYRAKCQGCHEPQKVDATGQGKNFLYAPHELPFGSEADGQHIATDTAQADHFNAPIEAAGNQLLPTLVSGVFVGIQDWYFKTHPGDANRATLWANVYDPATNPKGLRRASPQFGLAGTFRPRSVYRAPPLDGIWSTAPYLHNGSVPTLSDLLKKAADRPKVFWVGQRTYDTTNLGYDQVNRGGGASAPFDTSLPGNSNAGHEFGTDLPEVDPKEHFDKQALLEFLKGFGANKARPVILPAQAPAKPAAK